MARLSDIPNNDAVHWDGTRFGLLPTLPEEAEYIAREGQVVVPILLDAMTDPHLFVAAHVLLTRITGVQHGTFPAWNGLTVDLRGEAEVSIDPDQMPNLARRWKLYFQTEPRPSLLPP
jgi:hypothetical protein